MAAIREQVARLLQRHAEAGRLPPILIEGETGTGKGLLARMIHRLSSRRNGPFVEINCAAIPETLLEAELFGFERGAFTDARHAKPGLFQAAHRGVLFLDEVGLLPTSLQGKVLNVIEQRVVRRLGSVHGEPTDIWIIAATNDDLLSSTRARHFREDLYHRLAALRLWLAPLRERGDDVVLLAEHFLARACADYRLPMKTLGGDARRALLGHAWPGNVRELSNAMERVALLSDDRSVTATALDLVGRAAAVRPVDGETAPRLREAVGDVERRRIVQVLGETAWNVSRAAARLEIPRSSLRYRLKKYGLHFTGREARRAAVQTPPIEMGDPGETAEATRPRPVDWQDRHLALLQVVLASSAADEPGGRAQHLIHTALGKVQSLGGTLEEQGAMGFVAVFGLEPVEDACTRAALAALAVQNAAQHARDADPLMPGLACALHAGHFLAGLAGSRGVIDMHARHRARAVLEALLIDARSGAILGSDTAAPLLERRFQLEPKAGIPVETTRAYRVVAREPTGYGLAGRPLTPLVGRAAEMALLEGVRGRVAAGHGQVVALVGEPGVGKSRITYELARAARELGWTVLEGHAASYGAATPYLPLSDLLRHCFRLDDRDPPRAVLAKIRGRLNALPDPGLAAIVPALLAVLGGSIEDAEWQRLDPPQRRERILDGVKRLLLRESQVRPLLLLFEDLHWIDAETQAVLDRVVESLPAARVLLLVNYRPEYHHGWGGKAYYHQLPIDPLPPESAGALLDALLGADAALEPIKRLVIERTEGNPFFIEESVHSLVETGVLGGERGAYRVIQVVDDFHVPDTAQAMLAARIDRLARDDKRLLQVAAVVGKDAPIALLEVIADVPGDALRRGLERLQIAEFVYETGLYPDLAYRFKHALTHDVAYGSLPPARRRELHERIVQVIEARQPDRLGEHVERLAHHAVRGELREKAVDYLRRAGVKAAARSAPHDARACLEQALSVLEELPESQSTLEQAFEIRLELRSAMQQLGDARRMLERLGEAEALAERLNDDRRRGRVCALATNDHSRLGNLDEALVTGARALEIAQRLGDVRLRILTTSFLGQAHYYRGEYERAVELTTANLAALPAEWTLEYFGNSAPASVYDRACLIRSLAELGRFREAAAHESEVIRIAESTQHAFTIASAHWAVGMLYLFKGEWAPARSLIEHEIAVARDGSLIFLLPFAVGAHAWVLAEIGEAVEATARLREGQELLESVAAGRRVAHSTWVYHSLGRAALALGRLDEARGLADRAIETAPSQRGFAAHARHLLGDIAAHQDRFDAEVAEDCYNDALSRARPCGMRPLVARCHVGLGNLYRRSGRLELAQEHLAAAAAMLREMDMQFWLGQLEESAERG